MMKIISAIIMLIGLFLGFEITIKANGVPQQLSALVPIIGAYVLGRALENFSKKDEENLILLRKLIEGKTKVDPEIKEPIIQVKEPHIEEPASESAVTDEKKLDNYKSSNKTKRNPIITWIILGLIIVSSVVFYIDSYVDLNESWRQPTSIESALLSNIMNEYEVSCNNYYVKKIDNYEYFIACIGNGSEWVYREIDIEKKKMFFLSQKAQQKLKPPK